MRNEGFGGDFIPSEQTEVGKEEADLTPVEIKVKSFDIAGLAAKIVKEKNLSLPSQKFVEDANT